VIGRDDRGQEVGREGLGLGFVHEHEPWVADEAEARAAVVPCGGEGQHARPCGRRRARAEAGEAPRQPLDEIRLVREHRGRARPREVGGDLLEEAEDAPGARLLGDPERAAQAREPAAVAPHAAPAAEELLGVGEEELGRGARHPVFVDEEGALAERGPHRLRVEPPRLELPLEPLEDEARRRAGRVEAPPQLGQGHVGGAAERQRVADRVRQRVQELRVRVAGRVVAEQRRHLVVRPEELAGRVPVAPAVGDPGGALELQPRAPGGIREHGEGEGGGPRREPVTAEQRRQPLVIEEGARAERAEERLRERVGVARRDGRGRRRAAGGEELRRPRRRRDEAPRPLERAVGARDVQPAPEVEAARQPLERGADGRGRRAQRPGDEAEQLRRAAGVALRDAEVVRVEQVLEQAVQAALVELEGRLDPAHELRRHLGRDVPVDAEVRQVILQHEGARGAQHAAGARDEVRRAEQPPGLRVRRDVGPVVEQPAVEALPLRRVGEPRRRLGVGDPELLARGVGERAEDAAQGDRRRQARVDRRGARRPRGVGDPVAERQAGEQRALVVGGREAGQRAEAAGRVDPERQREHLLRAALTRDDRREDAQDALDKAEEGRLLAERRAGARLGAQLAEEEQHRVAERDDAPERLGLRLGGGREHLAGGRGRQHVAPAGAAGALEVGAAQEPARREQLLGAARRPQRQRGQPLAEAALGRRRPELGRLRRERAAGGVARRDGAEGRIVLERRDEIEHRGGAHGERGEERLQRLLVLGVEQRPRPAEQHAAQRLARGDGPGLVRLIPRAERPRLPRRVAEDRRAAQRRELRRGEAGGGARERPDEQRPQRPRWVERPRAHVPGEGGVARLGDRPREVEGARELARRDAVGPLRAEREAAPGAVELREQRLAGHAAQLRERVPLAPLVEPHGPGGERGDSGGRERAGPRGEVAVGLPPPRRIEGVEEHPLEQQGLDDRVRAHRVDPGRARPGEPAPPRRRARRRRPGARRAGGPGQRPRSGGGAGGRGPGGRGPLREGHGLPGRPGVRPRAVRRARVAAGSCTTRPAPRRARAIPHAVRTRAAARRERGGDPRVPARGRAGALLASAPAPCAPTG
jgi:hypothetical protein